MPFDMPTKDQLPDETKEMPHAQQRDFDLFNFGPVPMWVYDTSTLRILAANEAAQKDYGYSLAEFLSLTVKILWPKEDVPAMDKGVVRHIKKDGKVIYVDLESRPLPSWGENTRIVIALDITASKRLNDLESLEKKVFELNSRSGVLLSAVLASYVQGIEALFPEMHCSIMQLKNDRLYAWACSSLPKEFIEQVEGARIGDNTGSCGTAAFLKETVIVTDIGNDPRWAEYQQIALASNLLACWSLPIINSEGAVMATFAIYYNQIREPDEEELKIIERASSLLKVILEGRQYAEALKSSNELYTYVNKATNDAIYDWNILTNQLEWGEAFFRIFGYQSAAGKFPIERWVEMIHPDDVVSITKDLKGALNDTTITNWRTTYRLKLEQGSYAFVEENGYILRNEDGEAIRMIGVLRDITERFNYIQTIEQHNIKLKEIVWGQTHLVRAPLARILGLVQLLNHPEPEDGNIDERQLITYLYASAKELDKVIKGIIDKSLG
jgi:PAS domain S-box-containing protein